MVSLVSPQWGVEWVAGFVLSFVRVGAGFVQVGDGFIEHWG